MAQEGWVQVNGGGSTGLMGATTDGAKSVGGVVDSVILSRFVGNNEHGSFREQFVYDTLADRKKRLIDMGDAIVALPGGFGTVDELFDVACARQLGFNEKPIVIVNTQGFFNGIRQYMLHAIETRFVSAAMTKAMLFADTPDEAVRMLKDFGHVVIDKAAVNSGEMRNAEQNSAE